jgi:hypothetical protein
MDLSAALREINSCVPDGRKACSIEFVTCDVKRRTGGELKRLERCRVTGQSHDKMEHGTITVQPAKEPRPTTLHVRLIMRVNDIFING